MLIPCVKHYLNQNWKMWWYRGKIISKEWRLNYKYLHLTNLNDIMYIVFQFPNSNFKISQLIFVESHVFVVPYPYDNNNVCLLACSFHHGTHYTVFITPFVLFLLVSQLIKFLLECVGYLLKLNFLIYWALKSRMKPL